MIMFWVLVVAMLGVALLFVIRPMQLDSSKSDIDRAAQNIAITKERLVELNLDLQQGIITQTEYDQSKEELELSLLSDVDQKSSKNQKQGNGQSYNRLTQLILLVSVPVLALSLYAYLGKPELLEGTKKQVTKVAGHASSKGQQQQFEQVVAQLAERMQAKPDNAEGWFMLGRSYMSLKRFDEAVDALEKSYKLVPENPSVILMYADALTMLRNGSISGKPFELIKKAVAIKPDDPTGLWLIGMGYAEQGEFQKAISYWNILLPILKDEKSINEVQKLIRQAKSKSGIDIAEEPAINGQPDKNKSITALKLKVSIDQSMLKNVSMNDTVFIFAKAVNGPPMPLAVVRKQVKDLPIDVILDDTMAMIPNMTLSSFDKVKITARVSKTGKPLLQKGDIYSKEQQIQLPFTDFINIKIDSIAE